jgi:hypothetical protein
MTALNLQIMKKTLILKYIKIKDAKEPREQIGEMIALKVKKLQED